MITTFIGPMFSGKSQKLIDIYNNIYNKKTIFTFKPNIDKRDMMYIKSRNNDFEIYNYDHNLQQFSSVGCLHLYLFLSAFFYGNQMVYQKYQ